MVFEPHICVGLLLVIHLKKYQFYGDFVDLIVLFATKSMLSMTIQLLFNFFFIDNKYKGNILTLTIRVRV